MEEGSQVFSPLQNFKSLLYISVLFIVLALIQSCKKESADIYDKHKELSKAEIITLTSFFNETKGSSTVKLTGISSQNTQLTFSIDSSKIYKVKDSSGGVTLSLRLIPSTGDSRRVFYNLYYKKDATGKISQIIVKFIPNSATIKSGFSFFEGSHEIISTDTIHQGLIKNNSTPSNVKKNITQLQCVEIAFEVPCSNGFVHNIDGPGIWCQVEGSSTFTIRDCWDVGGSSSMTSFAQSVNATATSSSGTVLVSPSSLNNIILCEDAERDNFIYSLAETYKSWITSSTDNQNTFNQLVSSVCGDISDKNKYYIISTIEYLINANGVFEEKEDETTDTDIFDPSAKVDTSIYSPYDNSTVWPLISSVIPANKFVGWMYPGINKNCFDYAKYQIGIYGYKPGALYSSSHLQVYSTTGPNLGLIKNSVGYLIYALKKGIPVIVGVDDQTGASNADNVTDHFVVIVGSGTEPNGQKYFLFYDNAANYTKPLPGISSENKLYYNEQQGIITGKSQTSYASVPGRHDYIVTQVRKSVK